MAKETEGTADAGTASIADTVAATGKDAMLRVEAGISTVGEGVWKFFHQLPFHGAIVGGAVGLGAAMAVGVGELIAGCFTAYVTYRMFAYGESLTEAIEKCIKFERGELPDAEIQKPVPK